jgi:hypothetical protein
VPYRAATSEAKTMKTKTMKTKTMKTKTWTVITNTGKHADLESGLEKKEVQKPMHN